MKKRTAKKYMIGGVVLVMGSAAFADTYLLGGNQGSSQDWNTLGDWNNAVGGTHPTAILATDDFDMDGKVLRGPTSASPVFGGKSLTSNGGPILFKHTGTATITNFTEAAGSVLIAGNAATQSVHLVGFSVTAFAELSAGSGRGLDFQIDGLSGSGDMRTGDSSSDLGYYGLMITGASGYAGKILSVFGTTDWKNNADLSGATYEIVTAGYEDVILNSDIKVGALTIGTTTYTPGEYSFATLNAAHDSSFVDGGTGSITVIPEPATLGLLATAAAGVMAVRRFLSM